MIMADLGADVVKVEDPERPDESRSVGPYFQHGQSLYFASLNWGKRSLGIRLGHPEGQRVLRELVRSSDVVVDNFRPGVTKKLGLDHDTLRGTNPRIITCSITGYGETGPYAKQAGYDYTIQAVSGVMSMTGEPDGPPGKAGMSYVDHSGGLSGALAVCAALVERERTGSGRHIDLGLFDVQVSMLSYLASWHLNAGFEPTRTANASHPSLVPAQTFMTADGHVSVFIGNDPMWERFVTAVGDESLRDARLGTSGGRYEHRQELISRLTSLLRSRTSDDWVSALNQQGVPCGRVNSLGEGLADPQAEARHLVQLAANDSYGPYRHVSGPLPAMVDPRPASAAPLLGQHTAEVLADLGYAAEEIECALADGAAVKASSTSSSRPDTTKRRLQ
jgi:crotonobetainyl-CoA:carnitine CoA-transferase CaiB-like acyl-CoA transferase